MLFSLDPNTTEDVRFYVGSLNASGQTLYRVSRGGWRVIEDVPMRLRHTICPLCAQMDLTHESIPIQMCRLQGHLPMCRRHLMQHAFKEQGGVCFDCGAEVPNGGVQEWEPNGEGYPNLVYYDVECSDMVDEAVAVCGPCNKWRRHTARRLADLWVDRHHWHEAPDVLQTVTTYLDQCNGGRTGKPMWFGARGYQTLLVVDMRTVGGELEGASARRRSYGGTRGRRKRRNYRGEF